MKLQAKTRLYALTKKQKQLDVNKDGKIDSEDLKRLREGEKPEDAAITAGSWGTKPLQTDGSASAFEEVYNKFEKLLQSAERQALRDLKNPSNNDVNLWTYAIGYVGFMMQHNAFISPQLKQATLEWCKTENSAATRKFAEVLKAYKPTIRKDLGVSLWALKDMASERLETYKQK